MRRQQAGLDVSIVSEVAAEAGLNFSLQEVEELIEATDSLDSDRHSGDEEQKEEEQQRQEGKRQVEWEHQVKLDWQERVVAPLTSSQSLSTSWLSALSAVLLRVVEEEVRMERLLAKPGSAERLQTRRKEADGDDPQSVWSRYEGIIAQVKQELMQQHVSLPHSAARAHSVARCITAADCICVVSFGVVVLTA